MLPRELEILLQGAPHASLVVDNARTHLLSECSAHKRRRDEHRQFTLKAAVVDGTMVEISSTAGRRRRRKARQRYGGEFQRQTDAIVKSTEEQLQNLRLGQEQRHSVNQRETLSSILEHNYFRSGSSRRRRRQLPMDDRWDDCSSDDEPTLPLASALRRAHLAAHEDEVSTDESTLRWSSVSSVDETSHSSGSSSGPKKPARDWDGLLHT